MKTFDINSLIRPNIRTLNPYRSARDEFRGKASIYLDANENPFPSPYHRYPDARQQKLRTAVSKAKGTTPEQTLVTHGSDEAIDLILRAFCRPQRDNVIIPQPTYGMYATFAAINDIPIREVPLTANFALDADALEAAIDENSRIVFLCSPNNPTGNLLRAKEIQELLKKFRGLVVIDEAYIDFADTRSWINELQNYPNLVILQTFSKAWGLAGIRAGVCLAPPAVIEVLEKIKPPYNVSSATEKILRSALRRQQRMKDQKAIIKREREKLGGRLRRFAYVIEVFPSDANFILVRVTDASRIYQALLAHGIVVRQRSGALHCDNCLRITVGTPEQNKRLLNVMKSL